MVYSMPSKWLMQKYPPLATADGGEDGSSYHRLFDPFYRGPCEAGRQVRVLHARQLHDARGERAGLAPDVAAARHPVLVVPGLYLAEDSLLDWFAAYAHAGGHLVLGPRTGYADQEARARHEPGPARLVAAAGASYDEFSNLSAYLPLRAVQGEFPCGPEHGGGGGGVVVHHPGMRVREHAAVEGPADEDTDSAGGAQRHQGHRRQPGHGGDAVGGPAPGAGRRPPRRTGRSRSPPAHRAPGLRRSGGRRHRLSGGPLAGAATGTDLVVDGGMSGLRVRPRG